MVRFHRRVSRPSNPLGVKRWWQLSVPAENCVVALKQDVHFVRAQVPESGTRMFNAARQWALCGLDVGAPGGCHWASIEKFGLQLILAHELFSSLFAA